MKNISKHIFSGLMVSSMLLSSVFCLTSLIGNDYTKTSYAEGGPSFSVSVYDKNNELLIPNSSSLETKTIDSESFNGYTSYKWQDVNYFNFTIPDLSGCFGDNTADNNFKLIIDWYQSEISDLKTFEIKHSANGIVAEYSEFEKKQSFTVENLYIDNLQSNSCFSILYNKNESKAEFYNTNGGWGVYKFTIYANDNKISSVLIEVLPNELSEIDFTETPLLIESKETRSEFSISSAFEIYIQNTANENKENPYLYLKKNSLKWVITGEGSDGTSYVLYPSQAKLGETPLLKTNESNDFLGSSIKFDFDISGTWSIQCIAEENSTKIQSNTLYVSTIQTFKTSYIILIVVGIIIIGSIILYIIIRATKKKERIW